MLISLLIYGFTLALLFWGSSFARKGELKSDYLSLEIQTQQRVLHVLVFSFTMSLKIQHFKKQQT